MHGLSGRVTLPQDGAMADARALQAITGALAAASTDEEIAQITCASAMASLDVTAGAVVLMDNGEMVIGAVVGYPAEMTPALRSPVDDRDGFLEAIVTTGQPGVFGSQDELAARFPDRAERIRSLPYHAVAFLPIPGRRGTQGVLNVTRAEQRAFDEDELELLDAIARQTGVALERARHLDELERSLVRERALQSISAGLARDRTMSEMAETLLDSLDLLGASMGYVAEIDGAEMVMLASRGYPPASLDSLARMPLEGSPVADAIARRRRRSS